MPGVADVGRRHLLEDAADVGLAGALEERRLDADALVDRAADLGRRRGRVDRLDDGAADHHDAGAGINSETGIRTVSATALSVSKGASPRICWSMAVWMPM